MKGRARTATSGGGLWTLAGLLAACGQAKPPPPSVPLPSIPPPATAPTASDAGALPAAPVGDGSTGAESDAGTLASADAAPEAEGEPQSCPAGMILVDTTYCPRIERTCVEEEYSPQNHIVICHRFSQKQQCIGAEEHRRFCIDEFEYPNRAGAHPPWMVSWFDAQATCQSLRKRLCFESEWVSACEGPDKAPFPYGFSRDNAKC